MGEVREQQKSATRRAVIDAAIQVFARLGYEGSNYREISAASGATRQLILYHFKSKEALWRAAAEEVENRFNTCFEDLHHPENFTADRDRVRHSLSCFIQALCEVPEYGQIYLREGVAQGERMEWLAHHFAPRGALQMEFQDPELAARLRVSILRDILASTLVSFIALGPLLDRSHAVAARSSSPGLHPLSEAKREELLDHLMRLIY